MDLIRTSGGGAHSKRSCLTRHIGFCRDFNVGFTLAEVLITLGIIGIVAALVLPNVVTQFQKKQTISQLKATYSILTQAINVSVNENGPMATWNFELNNRDFANKYVLPYLKISKTITANNSTWNLRALSGVGLFSWPGPGSNMGENPIYILPNGSAIAVKRFLALRTQITVDINGQKGPNKTGRDGFVFYFEPSSNKINPEGLQNVLTTQGNRLDRDDLLKQAKAGGYACSKGGTDGAHYRGMYCSAVIMLDGWQILDDYPW